MSRWLSTVVWAIVLLLLPVSSLVAEEKPAAKKPKPAAAKPAPLGVGEAAIQKALAEPTTLEFVDTPLSDVIDSLKQRHHIEIQLDNKALDDLGVTNDTPITKNLRGVSLRSALNLMLRDLNMTWTINNEVLLITTPEETEAQLITKVYDVADLVACRNDDDELWDDYDTLIDVIATTVLPTTWDQTGGPGSISGVSLGTAKVLIVSQTQQAHEEIASLLADIRKIAKKNPDEEPPRRSESIVRPKPDLGGLGADGFHDATPVPPREKELPKKDQPAAPETPKKPGGERGGK